MPTLPGLLIELVSAAWQLSLVVIPVLYLVFLGHSLGRERSLAAAVHSQRGYTRHYGVHVAAGLLAGGASLMAIGGGAGAVLGGAVALAAWLYSYLERDVPERQEVDTASWRGRLALSWLLVPLLAAAALATMAPLLQSLVALVFLTTVFWEV